MNEVQIDNNAIVKETHWIEVAAVEQLITTINEGARFQCVIIPFSSILTENCKYGISFVPRFCDSAYLKIYMYTCSLYRYNLNKC